MGSHSRAHGSVILVVAAIATAQLPASDARGYPISPVTLWDLIETADLVVWAEVDHAGRRPDHDPEDRDDWNSGEAGLRVLETWKGPRVERATVHYEPNLICPAPAVYREGERVLAFLERAPGGVWHTLALSYGTLYPRGEEVDDYRHLVRWALRLQRSPRPARDGERLDWLVEAASRPGTRWHGLYELDPEADWVHAYYDQTERPAAQPPLSRAHLQKLADGFVAAPPTEVELPMALALLHEWESVEVDLAAISVVEAVVATGKPPYWLRDALGLLLLRLGDPDPAVRLAVLGEPFDAIDPDRLREVWQRARADLAIPEVPPAELPQDVVWGVGASTPD